MPGTHAVTYSSGIDSIEIKHTAFNRTGFALGAVVAAEWLKEKKGIYSMKDVLGLRFSSALKALPVEEAEDDDWPYYQTSPQ